MTLEEKREAIRLHCEMSYGCDFCPVYPLVKDTTEQCYSPGDAKRKEPNIERNFNLIFGGRKPESDENRGEKVQKGDSMEKNCGNCHYILCAAFDYPCASCWDKNKWEPKEEKQNPYWERITALAEKQRKKGMSKYGQGLEANPADILARINHLQEELIDGLMYCEWIKEWVQENLVKREGDQE